MYQDYFGLKDAPFSIAPDPQFLYMSERHREALGHLVYGMQVNGGFVLLTGEVGTGKTTVCRCLLEQLPEKTEVAFLFNPKLTELELLASLCDELKIDYPAGSSNKQLIDAINRFLLEAHSRGRNTVLIIDEAQNLSPPVLEQIRLLTNLETHKQKLLQVILLGQPELQQLLARTELRQLAQRITARYHLEALDAQELKSYVAHRLAVAGIERPLFSPAALRKLYRLSGGIPRLINLLCDRALLGAYVREETVVGPSLLGEAAREVFGERPKEALSSGPLWRWAFLALLVLGLGIAWLQVPGFAPEARVAVPVLPAAAPVAAPLVEGEVKLPRLVWDDVAPASDSEASAYKELFNRWDLAFQLDEPAAAQAARQGLRLVSKTDSFAQLKRLNRPVVLKLNTAGQEFYATLTALNEETATLVIGGEAHSVPAEELKAHWFGEFFLLWQAPPAYQTSLAPGARGEVVQWLDRQLASLNGRDPVGDPDPALDGTLLEELKRFQATEGLVPDGIVGTYTLVHLNQKLSDRQPTLFAEGRGD